MKWDAVEVNGAAMGVENVEFRSIVRNGRNTGVEGSSPSLSTIKIQSLSSSALCSDMVPQKY
jgi:hypothetical protein